MSSTAHLEGVDYHRRMIDDTLRVEAFLRAIEATVTPDDVVLDIGAGTGILSMFAARAGARKVYAVELAPVARLARKIVAANGYDAVIEVIEGDVRTLDLPEKVTVLVSDCLGNFLLSDAMVNVLASARRLLAPNARILPRYVDLKLAPGWVGVLLGHMRAWDDPRFGFTFDAARMSAANEVYAAQVPPGCLAAEPATISRWELTGPLLPAVPARWEMAKAGTVDGVVGWFTASFTDDVVLDTAPGIYTHWGQTIFPLPPTDVDPGDLLKFELSIAISPEELPSYHWRGSFAAPDQEPCVLFERGQDHRFEPWEVMDLDEL